MKKSITRHNNLIATLKDIEDKKEDVMPGDF